jgi:Reverse transcriptase (RNA-dependent DNA polymerase)
LYHEVGKRKTPPPFTLPPPVVPPAPDPPSEPPPPEPPPTRETVADQLDNWSRAPPKSPPSPKPPTPTSRYPSRVRHEPERLAPTMKGKSYDKPPRYLSALAAALAITNTVQVSPPTVHLLQHQAIGMDPFTGIQEFGHPGMLQSPMALTAMAMKAKKSKDPDIPSTREALSGPYAEEFWQSMDEEIRSLEGKDTWQVVDRSSVPKDCKVIPGTWTHRVKRRPDGRLNKFKSRWCFRGDLERATYQGDPYSPLVGWPTVRAALLLAATQGWKSRQVDFTLAFCQSPQKREVYMEMPQYYRPKSFQGRDVVLRLEKSLYGQMDSPRLFYEHLCVGMNELGFVATKSDPCLFIHKTLPIMVLNYCDDQIWLSPNDALIESHVDKLSKLGYDLTLEPKGDMFGFLGIDFKRSGSAIELTQAGLIQKVIAYTGMEQANALSTPALKEPLGSDANGEPFSEKWNYAAAIGMLLYISSNTRPDIQFAVHQAARFTHMPKRSHGQAVKRIIRYLSGTSDKGIRFTPDLAQGLDCYVDADFAGLYGYEDHEDPVCVKSRTGFTLTLFGCPIIWSSKLQSEITLSSTAAEYVAFSMAMRELLPMRALLDEIASKLKLKFVTKSLIRSTVFEDNQGCLSMVNVPKLSTRNKYLSLKYHFFRSHIGESKGIVAKYIRTHEQKADIFTKGLGPEQFQSIRKLLIGW